MPMGRTHDRITQRLISPVVISCFFITSNILISVLVGVSFVVGGLMLGPDLDTRSVQYNRWGIFRWMWWPYKKMIPHRSFLSHGPIIGTLVRAIYLFSVVAAVCALVIGFCLFFEMPLVHLRPALMFGLILLRSYEIWAVVLLGLEVGASSHYIADWVSTTAKRIASWMSKAMKPMTSWMSKTFKLQRRKRRK